MSGAGVGAGAGYYASPGGFYGSSESGVTRTPRAVQMRKTPQQVEALERVFFGESRTFNPSVRATADLIRRAEQATGLSRKQIRQWFQYKRSKAKRPGAGGGDGSSSSAYAKLASTEKGTPLRCNRHKKLMVLYDCKGSGAPSASIYRCKGQATDDAGVMEACVWSKVKPITANAAVASLFRGWSAVDLDAAPKCSYCSNVVERCSAPALRGCWPGIDIEPLQHAFLVVCKAGHVYGDVVLATSDLDSSMDRGYLAPPGI